VKIVAQAHAAPQTRPAAHRLLQPVAHLDAQPPLPFAPPERPPEPKVDPALRKLAFAVTAALVEVLSGRRSAARLAAWFEPRPRDLMETLSRTHATAELQLRAVRVQQPRPNTLEVAAHLVADGRSRAAALRFDRRGARWKVSRLEVGLRPNQVHRARQAA
jgi:hypothetical protein